MTVINWNISGSRCNVCVPARHWPYTGNLWFLSKTSNAGLTSCWLTALYSALHFTPAALWIFIRCNCWPSSFFNERCSSRVCCLLLHRSRVHLLINLITSNSALVLKTAFPTSCKCARIISLFFCCYKQKPASSVKLQKNNTTLNFDVSPA